MKKGSTFLIAILLVSLLMSGWLAWQYKHVITENEKLNQKITESNQMYAQQSKTLTINYLQYDDKNRLVENEINLLAMPRGNAPILRTISPYTAVKVIDAAVTDDTGLWLYVEIPVKDTPSNYKGWIRELATVAITPENQKKIISDVKVKAGTPLYENIVPPTEPLKFDYDRYGEITERQGGFVKLFFAGAEELWVEEQYIEYPAVEAGS